MIGSMRIDYVLLADGAVVRPDGKLDLFGAGFDTISAPTVPAIHPRLMIVLRAFAAPDEMESGREVRFQIRAPSGVVIGGGHGVLAPLDEHLRERLVPGQMMSVGSLAAFENLGLPEHGKYEVTVEIDGVDPHELELFVTDRR
jgi:hypothetical protein